MQPKYVVPILMTLLIARAVEAQTPRQIQVTAPSANVRTGPGTNQLILGAVPAGTVLELIRDSDLWFQVRIAPELGLGATTGYVHKSTARLLESKPAAPMRQDVGQPSPTPAAVVPSAEPPSKMFTPGSPKDPGTAMIISFFLPGGGHMYSGETRKGATILGVGLGGLVLGFALTSSSVGASCEGYVCEDDTNWAPAALGYLTYLGAWLYGLVDATSSADRMNRKNGHVRTSQRTSPFIKTGGGSTTIGLSTAF